MKWRSLLVLGLLLASALAVPSMAIPGARAAEITSSCKWGFPWPRTIWYNVRAGGDSGYSAGGIASIESAGTTWTNAGSNLSLGRTGGTGTGGSEWFKLTDYNDVALARTAPEPSSYCNVDQGNPVYKVRTWFNMRYTFYNGCENIYPQCQQNNIYDTANLATHEFGHWFVLYDTYDGADVASTMYGYFNPGETSKRSLEYQDWHGTHVMYGVR